MPRFVPVCPSLLYIILCLNSSCLVLPRFSAPFSLLRVSTKFYLVLLPLIYIQELPQGNKLGEYSIYFACFLYL